MSLSSDPYPVKASMNLRNNPVSFRIFAPTGFYLRVTNLVARDIERGGAEVDWLMFVVASLVSMLIEL